jgi:hypothetical protein
MGGFIRSKLFVDEDFISYFVIPLRAWAITNAQIWVEFG